MSMMVPKIDLANHSFDANAEWSSDFASGSLALTANQNIAKGQPVCIDYGAELDNTDLMRVFGFVVPGNPNDRLDFLQQQIGDDTADSHNTSSNVIWDQQSRSKLLAGPFLQSDGLDSAAEQFNQISSGHSGQGSVLNHEDPLLARKLSAALSLPLDASNQNAEAAVDDQLSQAGVLFI